jgi:Zn-dependent peptidase ImmA (M78 family)
MRRPDDCSLTPSQLARIQKEAQRALQEASVLGVLPTPVEQVMAAARVQEVEEDVLDPTFVARVLNKAQQAGHAIKRALSKVVGLFQASEGLVFIDRTLMRVKQRFVRLHEAAHGFLPWQRPMYAVVEDCEKSLDPETADLFDREANVFASEVLFQLNTFRDMAEEKPFSIWTPVRMAATFNASLYASIRQYVAKNHRASAVVILDMPQIEEHVGFRASVRRVVQSSSFSAMVGRIAWKDSYTPDDDLGALVPLGQRRGSGKRQLGLTDANGDLHECVAEAFTNKQQVFVLILLKKSLTATRVLFGPMAVSTL